MRIKVDSIGRLQALVLSLSISLIVGIAGCGGGSSTGGGSGTTTATVTAIAVSPSTASVMAGATQQFTATATYSNGTTGNVSSTATWTSSTTSVATISATGLATGVAAGSSTVTAALSGVSGTAALTVSAATVKSIAITPGTASVAAGATQQFTATATYSNGVTANVSSTATWTSSNTAAAKISSTGLATGVAAGSTTVMASFSGASSTAALNVSAAVVTVSSIAVTPGTANLTVGATQQFTATATYSNGTTANVSSTATWTSSSTAAATISSTGLATAVASGSTTITASLSGVSGTAVLTVVAAGGAGTPTSIAITPNPASFAMGATQQFTATATYSNNTTANITTTADWTVANESVATISSGGLATAVASGTSTVTASLDGVSGTDAISVAIAAGTGVNVSTWHFDTNRSGLNASEQSLTPTNVTPQTFGKLFSYLVDGYTYAEPLLMSNVTINSSVHNVLYVATENDSVYAFDADNYGTGAPLWKTSLLKTGETPQTDDPDMLPDKGVTATPVIDPTTNTIYAVSTQNTTSGPTFRLNALDITTGLPKYGGPVTINASVPGTNSDAVNGMVSLTTSCIQRAALLLANGNVYIGFGGCHDGWLLAYNKTTLAQVGVFNSSPNLDGEGAYASAGGVWMGSGGPVADSAGNIYIATGNGPWDGSTAYADSVLKFNATLGWTSGKNGAPIDYFTPYDYQYMDCNDADLASGGLLMIPGSTELLAGGKTGKLYMVNSGNLGHETMNDTGATQTLEFQSGSYTSQPCPDANGNSYTATINSFEIFGTAAYFNGSVYLGITPTSLTAAAGIGRFTYTGGMLTPVDYTTPSVQENTRGTTPFLSANGTSNGIMWMIDQGQPIQSPETSTNAVLRAYDATNLSDELYNSSVNSADVPGYGIKFSSPVVANGKVYISTAHNLITTTNPQGEIDVYGLH